MDTEIWKMIPEYEGRYMASTFGRVRSIAGGHRSGRILVPQKTTRYYKVYVRNENGEKQIMVSRLVAMTFLGEPNGRYVCHNNNDSFDNRLENLRYDTQKGNCADKKRHGTHQYGERVGNHKVTEADVLSIRSDKRTGPELAAEYGVTKECIWLIRRRQNWAWLA